MLIKCCPSCYSSDIVIDAAAVWSSERDQWELAGTQDTITCNACGRETETTVDFDAGAIGALYDALSVMLADGVDVGSRKRAYAAIEAAVVGG